MEKEKRRYSGQSFEDRQAGRRAELVRAALEVIGRHGREASVAAICAEAGLTARYFYESWPNRDAIFVDAYRLAQSMLLADIERRIDRSEPVKSALAAFYGALAEHPSLARVFLVDLDDHTPEMRAVSQEASRRLAALLVPRVKEPLEVAGSLGAVVQIAKRWIDGGFASSVEKVAATAYPFTQVTAKASRPRSASRP